MTSARRKKFLRLKKGGRGKGFLKPLIVVLLAFFSFLFLSFNTRIWKSDFKVGLVVGSANGDIIVVSADPKEEDVTNIIIPANTELEVASQLGRWKAKSIWQLGENEKRGGSLLRETVVKNFHFPVLGWADKGAAGFANGDALGIIKAIVLPYKSNLTLADKIRLGIFSLGVKSSDRNQVDLSESRFLKKTRLKDGEEGYLVSGKIPRELLVVFSQPQFAQRGLKVNIKDASGDFAVSSEVGETVEVMGAKVAAVTRLPKSGIDCRVSGREEEFKKILARMFECKIVKETAGGNFDVEIEIGEEFARRF